MAAMPVTLRRWSNKDRLKIDHRTCEVERMVSCTFQQEVASMVKRVRFVSKAGAIRFVYHHYSVTYIFFCSTRTSGRFSSLPCHSIGIHCDTIITLADAYYYRRKAHIQAFATSPFRDKTLFCKVIIECRTRPIASIICHG